MMPFLEALRDLASDVSYKCISGEVERVPRRSEIKQEEGLTEPIAARKKKGSPKARNQLMSHLRRNYQLTLRAP
jgi:hypothetical protein